MTVGELIKQLSSLPADTPVYMRDDDGFFVPDPETKLVKVVVASEGGSVYTPDDARRLNETRRLNQRQQNLPASDLEFSDEFAVLVISL
jgi:hypothetical protein